MRKKGEILGEIEGLARAIGIDTYECAALNSKLQQINQRIQGNLTRLDQLNSEKFENEPAEAPIHIPRDPSILPDIPAEADAPPPSTL